MTPARKPARRTADPIVYDRGDAALQTQVQTGLNLFLQLKNPAQMPALLQAIQAHLDAVHDALQGLHYVHFARFLPSRDGSTLMVITEFDGDLKSYIMDFVAVMGDIFTAILEFVADAPRLPVNRYPQDFWDFVQRNNIAQVQPWSAYKHATVIDVQGPRTTLRQAAPDAAPVALDLDDIQGNLLRGYNVSRARHFALTVGDAAAARGFIAGLVCGDESRSPQISTAAHWDRPPEYFLNLGLTWDGLQALGVDAGVLALFPPSFRDGARGRAEALGDVDASAPEHWRLGGPGQSPVHLLLSLFTKEAHAQQLERQTTVLRGLFAAHRLAESSCHDATALPGGRVHFGYKDGIAQPRIAGAGGRQAPDMQPAASSGEFLLGRDHVNQYGGNFAGDLPSALVDNASYAAVRMLRQDVDAFEDVLARASQRTNMHVELLAAKMMGRWRDGSPLMLAPDAPMPRMSAQRLNHFDYAPSTAQPDLIDDTLGLRCPIGSHIRRLNPRGALVTGKPHSRRLIRRGIPYGPAHDPKKPHDGIERGLFGLFICGDLEMQFEFLQQVWANDDVATSGIRDTVDPIIGAQPGGQGEFTIRTTDSRDPVRLYLPRWVTTRGSVYILIPGIGGLRHLAAP